MKLAQALAIAEKVKALLAPHCERIEIAGSIRRKKPDVKDIEIVAIPKPFDTGLFESGMAAVVNQWQKVKWELPCKYTQRILPDGIMLIFRHIGATNKMVTYVIRLRIGQILRPSITEFNTRSNRRRIMNQTEPLIKEAKSLFDKWEKGEDIPAGDWIKLGLAIGIAEYSSKN